jgi:Transglutaminase family
MRLTSAAAGALTVEAASLEALRNAAAHRTRRYELVRQQAPQPVLRRAQHFDLVLTFQQARPLDLDKDIIKLFFDFGESTFYFSNYLLELFASGAIVVS